MKRWAAIALLTLLCGCAPGPMREAYPPASEAELAANWEVRPPNLTGLNCIHLSRDRYVVVPAEHRDAALAILEERPFAALDEIDLDFRPETPLGLRAYLVRAVSKFQSTTFVVRDCGDLLFVMNGSLGRSTPPSVRMPIVVMLEDAPTQLAVDWEIAQ